MSEGNSLINFGDVSKPATVLIEKISEAVGGYFKPYQIRRISKAEAEAEIIKAQTQVEIADIQRRAISRFVSEETKRQENIENITLKAIPQLTEGSNPQGVEDDWLTNFFDKCRIVSDEEMQSLWAKVLAGEANSPGTYSKRTVNFLNSLDKSDATLFSSLCGFCWMIGGVTPLVYDVQSKIYVDNSIDFQALTHLDNIGLISFSSLIGLQKIGLRQEGVVHYYGAPLAIKFNGEGEHNLNIGQVILTQIGLQLAPICGSKPVEGFFDYILQRWAEDGLNPSSPYPKLTGSRLT